MITQIYMMLLRKSIVKNVLCILNKIVFVIKLLFQIKGIAISDCHLWGLLRSPRWHTLWRTHPTEVSYYVLLAYYAEGRSNMLLQKQNTSVFIVHTLWDSLSISRALFQTFCFSIEIYY